MTATGLGALPDTRYRFVGNLSGGRHVLVSHDEPMVMVADKDGTLYRIAGNGLQGFKESDDPLDVEFATIDASVVLEDRIRILDYDPKATQYSIRDIFLK